MSRKLSVLFKVLIVKKNTYLNNSPLGYMEPLEKLQIHHNPKFFFFKVFIEVWPQLCRLLVLNNIKRGGIGK